jgi:NAD(P)-dependent dehydrogenase (short-subunit alcohol dehydrogenase family)
MGDPVGAWDLSDVPDQQGRRVVVTGAGSGLGLVVARELAKRGARVVMAARDVTKAGRHRADLLAEHPAASVDVLPLDLMDPASVRAFAAAVTAEPVDALLNVAGIAATPLRHNAQGWESQFATNHLGHFALTTLLLDALGRGWEPRVVTVASTVYRYGRLDLDRDDHLTGGRRYSPMRAYARSKLATMLFGLELDRRLRETSSPVRSVLAHPGMASTPMNTDRCHTLLDHLISPVATVVARAPEDAALPILYAATVPELEGGTFVGPRTEFRGPMRVTRLPVRPPADDRDLARRLWAVSEELTGTRSGLLSGAH